MKKTIRLKDLDCANCAAKLENAIGKLDGVAEVRVNFMSQKMIIEASDDRFESVMNEAKVLAGKIEPDMEIVY